MITDALFADYIFKTDNEMYDTAKDVLKEKFTQHEYLTTAEELKEFTDMFFDNRTAEDMEFDYITAVALAMPKYEQELRDQVSKLATSFSYEEMDTMDQAIFLLGYVEWKVLDTPKEVLLNEMIELAKRYSDDGAPRLLNGIMHKIFTPEIE
ncbi:MAG: hypothetical protein NTX91_04285 [candidate division SR1 bacterium]|nr:hypothetical protein [candidate division SR1 bacterium]